MDWCGCRHYRRDENPRWAAKSFPSASFLIDVMRWQSAKANLPALELLAGQDKVEIRSKRIGDQR
jgi:hypothetical protein